MNILFLAEGNADSWRSWSGTAKSLVDHMRAAGHTVHTADVELYGPNRWAAAAATFAPERNRWGSRYRLNRLPFYLRSRQAKRHLESYRGRVDAVLQIGATFRAVDDTSIPYFMYCDSNIRMAQHGAKSGYSDGTVLTSSELQAIAGRETAVYRGAAAIFPLSERVRRSFIDDFGIPGDRVRAIYAGPNFEPDRVAAAPRSRAGSHPPTVLFVGLQFHRKGGDLLVESFRRVRERVPDARLLLAGVPVGFVEGPGIECLGDLNKNTTEGAEALAAAYAGADVFALPTRYEPFGIAFIEAMHFGLPCIGPRAWAVPEIIADGDTGFTVAVEDIDALTDRLLRLLTNPELARTMGAAAQDRARSLFTWPHVVARMTETMTAAIEAHATRH
ncbi:MAG TPA: glycosyltransferase family 4 protein [Vicinamibacterales bacterium]|nr:glycosyltransferase family 4 protein [Vicinamibacterales bacterium]